MSKIFIFGFDGYYPQGGMDDLKVILDDETATATGPDFCIRPEVLAKVVADRELTYETFQVAHFDMHGSVLLVERWRFLTKWQVDRFGSTGSASMLMPEGRLLSRVEVKTDFDPQKLTP